MERSVISGSERPPQATPDSDSKSDASFDPLFDDEPDHLNASTDKSTTIGRQTSLAMPNNLPAQPPARAIAPPKNAPPLLTSDTYPLFSPDLLLTASIDGQVILWDKRVHAPGQGVGRLWMSEKTPPWCLSVRRVSRSRLLPFHLTSILGMLVR